MKMIPTQLKSYRFIKVSPNKAPIEKEWQKEGGNNYSYEDKEFQSYLKGSGMYGVATGFNNLIVIDFDSVVVQEKVISKLPKTFTVKTAGRGLLHKYYITDISESFKILDLNKETLVDVQGTGKQVIGPGSDLGTGKRYEIVDNSEISKITLYQIKEFFKEWIDIEKRANIKANEEKDEICAKIKDIVKVPDVLRDLDVDSKDGHCSCPMHSSKGGRCFSWKEDVWHCFHCDKSGNIFHLLMHARNIPFIEAKKELAKKAGIDIEFREKTTEIFQQQREVEELEVKDYYYFENVKKDKDMIIQDFLPKGVLTMFYAPPAQFKSLLAQYMGICITSGRPFLGLKTRKNPVLISDLEDNDQIIKTRWAGIRRGMRIRSKKFPLFYLQRKDVNLLDSSFVEKLRNTIKQYDIKFLIFDTLHRHADYDENSANDMNRLYTTIFQKLLEDGISIMFLHHTTKMGEFRGSSDFLGMCDLVYRVCRTKNTNKFRIINEKNRLGETSEIAGDIEFLDDDVIFSMRDAKEEKTEALSKLKELTSKIEIYFIDGQELQRKDVQVRLENESYEYSTATLSRCLSFLVEIGKLQYDEKNRKYSQLGHNEEVN